MHRACETCTYFEPDPNRDQGECRRTAPKHGTSTSMWPIISKFAWCGEYRWHDDQAAANADVYADAAFLPSSCLLP